MSFSCESIARHVLPIYRAYVAKELVERYGYTQVNAAKKIGTTQPAISQYLSSKRGRKKIANYDEIVPLVQKASVKVAKRIATATMSRNEFTMSFCDLCKELQKTGKI
jgi:predicted transcriptional regulator